VYEIVGVAPSGFTFPDGSEFWAALPMATRGTTGSTMAVSAMAVLTSDTTREVAETEVAGLFAQQRAEDPTIDERRRVRIWPFTEGMVEAGTPMMVGLLQATALFVFLIGCSNIAGLLLARGVERRRDVSVRLALGARRGQIVRQLLVEGMVLALLAVPGALVLAWGLFHALHGAMPASVLKYIPGWTSLGVDTRVAAVAVLASVVAAVAFSLLPALAASRVAPGMTVRDGSRSIAAGPGRLRYGLVVLQIALALPLLVSAGMTARAGQALAFGPQGYDPDGAYQIRTVLTTSRYPTSALQVTFVDRLLEAAGQVPGVTSAGVTTVLPSTTTYSDRRLIIDGVPDRPDQPRFANYRQISADYLETMRIPIVSGRGISERDTPEGLRVSVVSASLARRYFGDQSPLGRRIQAGSSDDTWTTIVGVAGDTIDDWFNARGVPTIYVPFAQNPTTQVNLVARTTGDPTHLADGLRLAVTSVDSDQPVFNGGPMRDQVYDRTVGLRLLAGLMSGLGLVALGLSGFGIYSLMASTVALRRREFGIRMALGASAGSVLGMTLRQGAIVILVGVAIGLPATVLLGRVIESALLGLLATDVLLVGGVTAVLALVALLATVIPARRATRLNPALVIRE
jgi:putative ABC transport system permease protein